METICLGAVKLHPQQPLAKLSPMPTPTPSRGNPPPERNTAPEEAREDGPKKESCLGAVKLHPQQPLAELSPLPYLLQIHFTKRLAGDRSSAAFRGYKATLVRLVSAEVKGPRKLLRIGRGSSISSQIWA
jgi:hypothetical protein